MDAYIKLGKYRTDFDVKKIASGVKDAKLSSKKWGQIVPEDGDLELKRDEGLHLYGKKALITALKNSERSAGRWRIIGENWDTLMIAGGVVRVDLNKPKRILMICTHTDELAAEIGDEKLLAETDGSKSFSSINIRELIKIIEALPDSKDL